MSCGPPLVGTWIGALCLTLLWLWTKPKSNSYLSRSTNAHKWWEPGPSVKMCQGLFCRAAPSPLMDCCTLSTALWAVIIRHLVSSLSERIFWLSGNHVSSSMHNAQPRLPHCHGPAALGPSFPAPSGTFWSQFHQPSSRMCGEWPASPSHLPVSAMHKYQLRIIHCSLDTPLNEEKSLFDRMLRTPWPRWHTQVVQLIPAYTAQPLHVKSTMCIQIRQAEHRQQVSGQSGQGICCADTSLCLYTPRRCLWDLGRSSCSCSHQATNVQASHSLWIVDWEGVQGFITVEKIKHNGS